VFHFSFNYQFFTRLGFVFTKEAGEIHDAFVID